MARHDVSALTEVFRDLAPGEQSELMKLIARGVSSAYRGTRTELDFVHAMLCDLEATRSTIAAAATAKAPSMFKEYRNVRHYPLSKDLVKMPYTLDDVIQARSARRDYVDKQIPFAALSTFLHWTGGIKKHVSAYNLGSFPVRFLLLAEADFSHGRCM